jgi:hypothetical protein
MGPFCKCMSPHLIRAPTRLSQRRNSSDVHSLEALASQASISTTVDAPPAPLVAPLGQSEHVTPALRGLHENLML